MELKYKNLNKVSVYFLFILYNQLLFYNRRDASIF